MFAFPASTIVNRVIPKARIIAQAQPRARLRALLTSQIQQIRWHAKLSPETVKLAATGEVPEIEVLQLELKGAEIHPDLIDLVDRAIPNPTLLLLEASTPQPLSCVSCAHKRPSENDRSKWVVGARFTSDWVASSEESAAPPLPRALDLGQLYTAIMQPLLPVPAREGEPLATLVERGEKHRGLSRQIEQVTAKVNRELQFNRRVALNQQLNLLKSHFAELA